MASGLVYVWRNDQMKGRILGAFDPTINPDSSGFVYKSLQKAVASAGWRGHGFGAGLENLTYAYTDMLPVYLIYCFGWGGGLVLLGIMLWFFLKLFSSFRAVNDRYGKAIVIVLSLMLAVKLIYGLLVISGRMVLTSLPFPFMSYGSHVFIEYAALGLLMGIYRRKDISPAASEQLGLNLE